MEYIKRIRAKVGSEKILMPASAVVILNEKGDVLLHLRNDTNSWGLPGGLMDIGETILESIEREVREETGLTIRDARLFGVFSGPKFEVQYPNGDQTAAVILGFFSSAYSGNLTPSEESPQLMFYSLSALPENMYKYHRWFVEGFIEFQRSGASTPVIQ